MLGKTSFAIPALLLVTLLCNGCQSHDFSVNTTKVAFIADVHFHDIFAATDTSFNPEILPRLADGTPVFARSMGGQLLSTRLFNENYFAFLAALDDIVARDIRYVVLNGDFSDDGQPIHMQAFIGILQHYEHEYGLRFFLSYGNHDPYLPYTIPAGKPDFLLNNGQVGGIYSPDHPNCIQGRAHCLEGLEELGYEDLFSLTAEFGFIPRPGDLHFETPFSRNETFDPNSIADRSFPICTEDESWCGITFDTSYLIEPEQGLWFMSIDANVHLPREIRENDVVTNPRNYVASGNAGFNAVVSHKTFLLEWMKDVADRARTQNKQLFVFSHYPAGDFYHNMGATLTDFFGKQRFQLRRLPTSETQQQLASTGIPFHVGGHMHVNNTHPLRDSSGTIRTWGIQSPSISAFVPSYTVIHYAGVDEVQVETILLQDVPDFNKLFPLYRQEWEKQLTPDWLTDILDTETYYDFTVEHLMQLIDRRFIPQDWPEPLASYLAHESLHNMAEMLLLAVPEVCSETLTLREMVQHFYLFRNGGTVAFDHIDKTNHSCYAQLSTLHSEAVRPDSAPLFSQFVTFLIILDGFSNPIPDRSFILRNSEIIGR